MTSEMAKKIDDLVDRLTVNDKKNVLDYEETPKEPKATMQELITIGRDAVVPLLRLLKNTSKYSCLYAIKALGEIRDPAAARPIVDTIFSEAYIDSFINELGEEKSALHKIGLPALQPTLDLLKEKIRQEDDRVYLAIDVLAGIKDEKSFMGLVNLLSVDWIEKDTLILRLVEYGDKRAVEYLKRILGDDDDREFALEAIRKWVLFGNIEASWLPTSLRTLRVLQKRLGKT